MIYQALDVIPIWLFFLANCLLGWLAMEAGYRFGQWRHSVATQEKEAPVGAIVASILGLLAFLLAFTFSMAASRFDAKRQAMLDEANAVGTTYLRTRLLAEPERTEIAKLMREYVDARIHGVKEGKIAETIARSEELHEVIWSQAVKAAENKNANSIMVGVFVQSLNEMIDLHAKRVMLGLRSRVPTVIWVILLSFAALGMAAVGYQAGLSATRRSPAMLVMVMAFASVFFLIADLDRPHEGFLSVGQQALVDVQKSMNAPSK